MDISSRNLLCASALLITSSNAFATPVIWDADYGTELTALTGCDDCKHTVELGFEFPFSSTVYATISVNDNGGIGLGNDVTTDIYTDYDIYTSENFERDFSSLGSPVLLPFGSDLDHTNEGLTYFKTDGSTAVITWVAVGTNQTETSPFITMQVTLKDDGTIIYGYNGITGDLITDLDAGIVVGFSAGDGVTPAGSIDLTATTSGTTTIYEIWCYDGSVGCFEPTQPNNDLFDLDDTNLIFTPDNAGGYTVSDRIVVPTPAQNNDGSGSLGLGALYIPALIFAGRLRRRIKS